MISVLFPNNSILLYDISGHEITDLFYPAENVISKIIFFFSSKIYNYDFIKKNFFFFLFYAFKYVFP
jgi:hypothetical protein